MQRISQWAWPSRAGREADREWRLQAFGVQQHSSASTLSNQQEHYFHGSSKSLFPLLGVNNASFHLQNKPVLSSNEPVFPAHTYSKCACWIKGSACLSQCGRCCFAQKSMKWHSFFKWILQFSASQIKH